MTVTQDRAPSSTKASASLPVEIVRATGLSATTKVATMAGEVSVGALKVGDRIFTRDDGAQPIRRIECRSITAPRSAVRIAPGAMGHGLPEQAMIVAADHRLLICSERAHLLLDDAEVLVAAGDMVGQPGFEWLAGQGVELYSIVLDFHEIMLCDGCWSESADPRRIVHGHGAPARRVLKRFEAQLIAGA